MIRTYKSGQVVEKSKFWVPEQTRTRGKKKAGSNPRKRDGNERSAVKTLARLINCNFSHGDLWLTLRYDAEGFASLGDGDVDEIKAAADKQLVLFLRRMQREFKKLGIAFRYISATSDMDGSTGEIVRAHHHIIMPRAAFEICQKQWKLGTVDYQLLRNQPDYTPLATYICKQIRRKEHENRWKFSRSLLRPEVSETETHSGGVLRPPAGSRVLSVGAYDEETGCHYIRYVPKPKVPKRGGHAAAKGGGADEL